MSDAAVGHDVDTNEPYKPRTKGRNSVSNLENNQTTTAEDLKKVQMAPKGVLSPTDSGKRVVTEEEDLIGIHDSKKSIDDAYQATHPYNTISKVNEPGNQIRVSSYRLRGAEVKRGDESIQAIQNSIMKINNTSHQVPEENELLD